METPKRIWWARPRKLVALERPGGGGRRHRPDRRAADIEYLKANGVRCVVSLMTTRHNLAAYEEAGLEAIHVPLGTWADAEEAWPEVVTPLQRGRGGRGAVPVHANRHTDMPAAVCAAVAERAYKIDAAAALVE